VAEEKCGLLIGANGCNVKAVYAATGCTVKVDNDDQLDAGQGKRWCYIRGPISSLAAAKKLVLDIAQIDDEPEDEPDVELYTGKNLPNQIYTPNALTQKATSQYWTRRPRVWFVGRWNWRRKSATPSLPAVMPTPARTIWKSSSEGEWDAPSAGDQLKLSTLFTFAGENGEWVLQLQWRLRRIF